METLEHINLYTGKPYVRNIGYEEKLVLKSSQVLELEGMIKALEIEILFMAEHVKQSQERDNEIKKMESQMWYLTYKLLRP